MSSSPSSPSASSTGRAALKVHLVAVAAGLLFAVGLGVSGMTKPSKVVDTKELLAKKMTVDEAITQIELLENDFLVFTNADTNHVAVLYRRKGENSYGLIDARAAS